MNGPAHKVILFDGVCNLCNKAVQFILKRDKKGLFVFGSLQGEAGRQYRTVFGVEDKSFDSFMLVEAGVLYTRSTAALRVLKQLGGGWKLLYGFIIVPRFIRDGVYSWISRNRYRWFGRQDTCWLPSPEWKGRFLD